MLDMQLYALMFGTLAQECPKRGLVGFEFTQRYQQTQEGIVTDPTVYVVKVGDKLYGAPSVKMVPKVAPAEGMSRIRRQIRDTTLQFSVTQPVAVAMDDRTHSDTLNLVASVMQTRDFQSILIQNGSSILRVTDVRLGHFINDMGQQEENPTFDAVIKHEDVFIDDIPEAKTFEFNLYRV